MARLHLPGARVFLRTRLFPGIQKLLEGVVWESFDALYEQAESLRDVSRMMAERLISSGDEVVLAVPGDGTLGEAVLSRLREGRAVVEVVPGIALGVAALAAAGLAAAGGAQIVEATSLGGSGIDLLIELNPGWPAVVTGVFNPRVAGDLKLALQRVYPPEHEICLVQHAGLDDEHIHAVPLAELDRTTREFDHLTHGVPPNVEG